LIFDEKCPFLRPWRRVLTLIDFINILHISDLDLNEKFKTSGSPPYYPMSSTQLSMLPKEKEISEFQNNRNRIFVLILKRFHAHASFGCTTNPEERDP
jgi:hypothetical protein